MKGATLAIARRGVQPPLVKNVQALRAIAALMVVLVHATLPYVGIEDIFGRDDTPWLGAFRYIGLSGVDLFFAISGFIMLVTSWDSFGTRGAGLRFFARRAFRIYPPYWLALAPILPVLFFAKDRFMVSHVGEKTGVLASIFLLPNPDKFVLTVAWTLVWEMFFYVVFAGMLGLQRRFVPAALAAWAVLELLAFATLNGSANFYVHFFAAPIPIEFILGAFVGLLYVHGRLPAPRTFAAAAVAVTALAFAVVAANRIDLGDPNNVARVVIFGMPAVLLVYAAVALEVRTRVIAPRFLVKIGDASYAMYLWHLAILVVLRNIVERLHLSGPLAHAAVIAITVAITIAVGMLVYRFFERPVTKRLNALLPAEPRVEPQADPEPEPHAPAPAPAPHRRRDTAATARDGIAIVGMAGRFPGAADLETFWNNLCAGVESVTTFAPETLEDPDDAARAATPGFVAARSVIDGVDLFDAGFFGMHPREAALTDPQHRVLLECCWQALEDAGYAAGTAAKRVGVVCGSSINTYFLRNVMQDRAALERFTRDYQVESFPELVGAGSDFLATRIAYKLDLHGPAMTVQSACSTSLLAVTQAATSLLLGNADMMLAGAVSITFPERRGYLHQDGGMLSADGHCRSFDAAASGTVFGSGAGVVVLKRLADAVADGDAIYAVLRGFGVTNDGSGKVGYTAPSVEGQAAAIRAAHEMAGVEPRAISYVECHGTATPLGDPIEFEALRRAFASDPADGKFCAIGSVKTNVGHLDIAAGMSGLIKTALALKAGAIPPTLHFTTPNPHIAYDASPFYVATDLTPWNDPDRRAGVSAFGLGGTNVHLVLEAPPAAAPARDEREPHILTLTARSDAALERAREDLAAHLERHPSLPLADVAFTLRSGRRVFSRRVAVAAATSEDAARSLRSSVRQGALANDAPRIALLFPGQGAQYVTMGRDLYASVGAFRDAFDRCADALGAHGNRDLRSVLGYRNPAEAASAEALAATALAQPAIFAVEYATAKMWEAFGLKPHATAGHSVGEFVSAVLADVMSVDDALRIVVARGREMQALPAGTMLAVRLSEGALRTYVSAPVAVAAVNASNLCVVAGPAPAVEELRASLEARDVSCRPLHTSHAFHSPMMRPVIEPMRALLGSIALREPDRPYVSTVTGDWIAAEQATSPSYWAEHCVEPVRFADALETLVRSGITTFVECGPGATLSTFVRQRNDARELTVASTLRAPDAVDSDLQTLRAAAARLWSVGAPLDLEAIDPTPCARRASLPTYPFERTRHWIDAPRSSSAGEMPTLPSVSVPTSDASAHRLALAQRAARLLEEISGLTIEDADLDVSFVELGFDSLQLGRYVRELQKAFGVTLTFRQLLGDLPSIDALASHLAERVPAPAHAPALPAAAALTTAAPVDVAAAGAAAGASDLTLFLREQVMATHDLMQRQLRALEALGAGPVPAAPPAAAVAAPPAAPAVPGDAPSRFDAFKIRPTASARTGMTDAQRSHVDALIRRTVARTAKSKALTQRHRAVLADPRVAAGFRSEWKEMVYPITCDRAAGSRLWDVDGNEYIDILNGFGQTAFGHGPDFVVEAVKERLDRGFAIGPQTDLAGDVAELFCELTGNERVTFCNTGSEAVMAALRLARTVTARDRVVVFGGAYHGQFDEVLVTSGARGSHHAVPVAPGIPGESVANMVVLDYGSAESLTWIREHANELAAVVVEPVQSRHPNLQPKAFLEELRAITAASGTALVFDEVVTGFRLHPGGMQALFGVRADLATYGKVAGGGMPIGILAGTARFMDALDGGTWQYGDDSVPEVAPTFFAGTFVRHPLVMAAVLAVLRHLRERGPQLQEALTRTTADLVARLNADIARRGISGRIETCGSLFYFNFSGEERLASLLYYHLRERGIYVQEGFPCFLTTAHGPAEVDAIARAFAASFDALQEVGIFGFREVALAPTESQTEVWLAAQLGDEASCAFNESITLRFETPPDEGALTAAWTRAVDRYDALRASFGRTGETMTIASASPLEFATFVAADDSEGAFEAQLAALTARDACTAFDLENGPLVRGTLVRSGTQLRALVFTAHHIVCDGWSMNVLLEDVAAYYEEIRSGTPAGRTTPLTFAAYARAERERDAAERERVAAFWRDRFATLPATLELPTDRPRTALRSFNGATRTAFVDAATLLAIKKAGGRTGCTLFVTLLGAFGTLVGRLAHQSDVVIGVPTAGQAAHEELPLVGHCVNFLPIRNTWTAETTVADMLVALKRGMSEAYDHQEYTLGTLVRALALPRDLNRLPLTEIQFNLERLSDGLLLDGARVAVEPNPKAFVNFDLFFNVIESATGLRIDCDYNTDLFDAGTIDRWLAYYRNVLDAIVRDASVPVERLSFVPTDEAHSLRSALEGPVVAAPAATTVHALFERQVGLRPRAIAVTCDDEAATFAELDRRANRLAHEIAARTGGAKLVGVALERSVDLLVALLATLKAGCAYVPLDPTHPPARLRAVSADAGLALVLTKGTIARDVWPAAAILDLDERADAIARRPERAPKIARGGRDLAYAIYTSGSTGTPKGVQIEHGAVVNLLAAMAAEPGLGPDDVLLAVTTVAFDIAALELFLPLAVGATVAIAPDGVARDGFRLLERIDRSGATVMQATPSTWLMLLEAGFKPGANLKMLCGGEALRRDLADRLLANDGELWNMYGPTETTIWSSCKRIEADEREISVGRPIRNTQFYVLDAALEPVPVGGTGELFIGGDGLARGYIGRPELDAEKFLAGPSGAGRIYRTGDLARVLPSGDLIVIGRTDAQVKLRGFRIELGEIEAALTRDAGVTAAAVILREDVPGDKRLVAYVVEGTGRATSPDALRAKLAAVLPDYMVPSHVVSLDALPLNANGKVDRAALPQPPAALESDAPFRAPETAIESALASIWREVLQLERVGTTDDLFALGADSIHLFKIVARANRQGIRFAARELLKHRTISDLASHLDREAVPT